MDIKKAKLRFSEQVQSARKRGIEFKLTFIEWSSWWEGQLGVNWLEKRGKRCGQYVMACKGDKGAYELRNIKCILATDNSKEATHPNGSNAYQALITEDVAHEIYTHDGCLVEMCYKHNIKYAAAYDIRRDRSWVRVTSKLHKGKNCPCGVRGSKCQLGLIRF